MTDTEIRHRLQTEPYFVNVRRCGYDLRRLEQQQPDGCDNKDLAQALHIPEEQVASEEVRIQTALQTLIGVTP